VKLSRGPGDMRSHPRRWPPRARGWFRSPGSADIRSSGTCAELVSVGALQGISPRAMARTCRRRLDSNPKLIVGRDRRVGARGIAGVPPDPREVTHLILALLLPTR